MTNFKKQLIGALSTGLLVANLLTPALALGADGGTTLVITGNGEDSKNKLDITSNNTTTVTQNNTANVTNNVDAKADSGGNTAKGVTGGNVSIDTGNAMSDVKVDNVLNKNVADVKCCQGGDTQVLISGNGEKSKNKVDLDQTSTNSVFQNNDAYVTNNVDSKANSGKNKVDSTTGGNVEITTGDATAKAKVSTTANANWAEIGGDGSKGGSITLIESGNGELSKNKIDLDLTKANTITQDNYAKVDNDVDASAKTGDNKAKSITGGDVTIDTGNADASADVSNLLNLNAAFTNCDCVGDIFAKESGNGEKSKNKIDADLTSTTEIFQGGKDNGNNADLYNDVDASAKSGKNKVESTVGVPHTDDPVTVTTGDSNSMTTVSNKANENIYGSAVLPIVWPDLGSSFSLEMDFFHLWLAH